MKNKKSKSQHAAGLAAGCLLAAALGCSDNTPKPAKNVVEDDVVKDEPEPVQDERSAVALLTRACGPDTCLSYVNVYASVEEMQRAERVDKASGREVSYAQGRTHEGSLYLFSRDEPTVTRWTVADDLSLHEEETLSFANTGTSIFCEICNVFSTPELAFHMDAIAGGVLVAWNPKTMELRSTSDVPEDIMKRLPNTDAELVFPRVFDGQAYYSASWASFDSLAIYDRAALVRFDATVEKPTLEVLEDDRCGGTYVSAPFADAEGNVYAMGDWRGGYFDVGILAEDRAPACLLRVKPGADAFDPDYYVNLLEVANARAIRNAYAMADGHLLLNILPASAPAVTEEEFMAEPFAYYSLTSFELVVLDLESLSVTPVDLPPAGAMSATPLSMDDRTFVQVYPDGPDAGAHLYEIKTDGTASKIIEAGSGNDFSMIARVR